MRENKVNDARRERHKYNRVISGRKVIGKKPEN